MPEPFDIDKIARELDGLLDRAGLYLNRETGELLLAPDCDVGAFEDGVEDDGLEWDWSDEDIEKLREIVHTRQWICLPSKFEIHEWAIMKRFAGEKREPLFSHLQDALHGSGAFRSFRNVLERAGMTAAWYEYKHEHLVQLVAEVLEEENIPFKRGA